MDLSDSSGICSRGGRGRTLLFISKGTAAGGPAVDGCGWAGPGAGPSMDKMEGCTETAGAGAGAPG